MKPRRARSIPRPAIISWKPKPATKAQRILRAMKHSLHRAERVPDTKCEVDICRKLREAGSRYCVHHGNLRYFSVPVSDPDAIQYGV